MLDKVSKLNWILLVEDPLYVVLVNCGIDDTVFWVIRLLLVVSIKELVEAWLLEDDNKEEKVDLSSVCSTLEPGTEIDDENVFSVSKLSSNGV